MTRATRWILVLLLIAIVAPATGSAEEQVMMSDAWAEGMCEAWNATDGLTQELAGWIRNNKGRGYKLMRIYRRDCPDSPRIEMKISESDDGVVCVAGGWASEEQLTGADYVMYADTSRWQEMGAGEYGPMKGMMTGRLKFEGPKFEAMRNMGPFTNFLLLVGKVPGSVDECPVVDAAAAQAEDVPVVEDLPPEDGDEVI